MDRALSEWLRAVDPVGRQAAKIVKFFLGPPITKYNAMAIELYEKEDGKNEDHR